MTRREVVRQTVKLVRLVPALPCDDALTSEWCKDAYFNYRINPVPCISLQITKKPLNSSSSVCLLSKLHPDQTLKRV